MTDRLNQLLEFHREDPTDSFVSYSIAQEYLKIGEIEKALEVFDSLRLSDPSYVGTYYHYGKALEAVDRFDQAKAVYEAGIVQCRKTGDTHALGELQGALMLLEDRLE